MPALVGSTDAGIDTGVDTGVDIGVDAGIDAGVNNREAHGLKNKGWQSSRE